MAIPSIIVFLKMGNKLSTTKYQFLTSTLMMPNLPLLFLDSANTHFCAQTSVESI